LREDLSLEPITAVELSEDPDLEEHNSEHE